MDKKARQRMIHELVQSGQITSQQEMLKCLREKGFRVSQSTLSKDFKEMGIIKIPNRKGGVRFVQTTEHETFHIEAMLKRELKSFVLDTLAVNNLVIVKTVQGNASGVSKYLDEIGWPEVAATMASVDTVLVITRSNRDAGAIVKQIQQIIETS